MGQTLAALDELLDPDLDGFVCLSDGEGHGGGV
jgi:hypothetical protein